MALMGCSGSAEITNEWEELLATHVLPSGYRADRPNPLTPWASPQWTFSHICSVMSWIPMEPVLPMEVTGQEEEVESRRTSSSAPHTQTFPTQSLFSGDSFSAQNLRREGSGLLIYSWETGNRDKALPLLGHMCFERECAGPGQEHGGKHLTSAFCLPHAQHLPLPLKRAQDGTLHAELWKAAMNNMVEQWNSQRVQPKEQDLTCPLSSLLTLLSHQIQSQPFGEQIPCGASLAALQTDFVEQRFNFITWGIGLCIEKR